ncbi:MAG: transposase [Verrucomicrobiales bacterium]|jgi:transposase
MYFRTKTIKGTPLVQLVESYRNAEGSPRQRVVASLGDADIPEVEKASIAGAVTRRLRGADSGEGENGFEPDLSADAAGWVARIVALAGRSRGGRQGVASAVLDGVLLDGIETTDVVELGPELVALKAWEELGLTRMLASLGMNPSRIATAQLLVANRFIEPLSEWALIDWAGHTALPEMLGTNITKRTKDRLYHTGDELLEHRVAIETALREHERDLFTSKRSIILYDVTNTHFEGVCADNPKAKHGRNKQKRNDCRQVAVGMAFDEFGLALAHEVFEGNVADTTTLGTLLDRLAPADCVGLKPVVVLDAGFASKANVELLRERHYSYLINITRNNRKKYAEFFEREQFDELPGRKPAIKVEVKKITDPEDKDSQLVLCRSAQRRLKEEAMISKAEARFLSDVGALRKRIEKGSLKDPAIIERKIGSLQKKHPRVQRYYKVARQPGTSGSTLEATRDEAKIEGALDLCGDYVFKTDKDMGAAELWGLYMTLLKAESGFRMLKGTLGLRPNFHQLEHRVDGHIFISVLAYHLLSWVRHHMDQAGDPREWKTLRRLLGTHSLVSTRLPLEDGRIVTVRKPSLPDAEQIRVYQILGIDWKRACPAVKSELKATATL